MAAEADETFEVTLQYQAAGVAQSFGPYLVTIENDDRPSAPLNLAATPGLDAVTLSWNTPTNGGPTITGYQYQQSIDGGDNWNPGWTAVPDSGPSTTGHTVMGLDSGTSYTFEVRAVNGAGPGAASVQATAAPTTSPPPAAPGGPAGRCRHRSGDAVVDHAARGRQPDHRLPVPAEQRRGVYLEPGVDRRPGQRAQHHRPHRHGGWSPAPPTPSRCARSATTGTERWRACR